MERQTQSLLTIRFTVLQQLGKYSACRANHSMFTYCLRPEQQQLQPYDQTLTFWLISSHPNKSWKIKMTIKMEVYKSA
jgi:hypothetical protein